VSDNEHILISLEPRHAENILEGRKVIELRRRTMNVAPGATLWIYAKQPVGSIIGRATVSAIHVCAPSTLWRKFGSLCGISRAEFFKYFAGISQGTALELTRCRRLNGAFTLQSLRQHDSRFQPPQFFVRLKQGTPLLAAISQPRSLQGTQ
jgi:predicted transcriptional regulator